MAVSVADGYPQAEGAKWGSVADVTGPSSYTTGGFTVSAVSLGMQYIDFASASTGSAGTHNYIVKSPAASDSPASSVTVMAILLSSGLEVSNGTNLSTSHFRLRAIGL